MVSSRRFRPWVSFCGSRLGTRHFVFWGNGGKVRAARLSSRKGVRHCAPHPLPRPLNRERLREGRAAKAREKSPSPPAPKMSPDGSKRHTSTTETHTTRVGKSKNQQESTKTKDESERAQGRERRIERKTKQVAIATTTLPLMTNPPDGDLPPPTATARLSSPASRCVSSPRRWQCQKARSAAATRREIFSLVLTAVESVGLLAAQNHR